MFFIQPLALVAEFVQDMVLIVLFGVLLVEYLSCWKGLGVYKNHLMKGEAKQSCREISFLSLALFFTSASILLEFVIGRELWYHFVFFHFPFLLLSLVFLWPVAKKSVRSVQIIFVALLIVTLLHYALFIGELLFLVPVLAGLLIDSFIHLITSSVLYFLIVIHLIHKRELHKEGS